MTLVASRRGRHFLATLVALVLVVVGLRASGVASLLAKESVPTFEVKRQPFIRRVSTEGYLRAVKSTPLTAPPEALGAQKIAWLAPDGSKVKKGDLVVRFDPSELEKKLRDGEADRASADAKIAKEQVLADSALRGRVRTANLSKTELEETRAFQSTDPEIFSKNQIIESGIDEELSTARMNHAGAAKGIESTLSKSKVDLIVVERQKADLHVGQAQTGLQSLEIHAPHDGIFVLTADNRGNVPHVGDSVWGGQPIAKLPLLDAMEAEVYVLEADAAGLAVGVTATVVLEAHPNPSFDAKIRRVDAIATPRTRDVPIQYFGATLELARTDRELMKPGERVHAQLVMDHKDAIAVPRQAIFEQDGKKVVQCERNGRFEAVPVKLGASSLGLVVIEEGLSEGDRIALRDPTKLSGRAGVLGSADRTPAGPAPSGRR